MVSIASWRRPSSMRLSFSAFWRSSTLASASFSALSSAALGTALRARRGGVRRGRRGQRRSPAAMPEQDWPIAANTGLLAALATIGQSLVEHRRDCGALARSPVLLPKLAGTICDCACVETSAVAASSESYRTHASGQCRYCLDQFDHPTLPSRLIPSSFCASTANSIGSCFSTSRAKPLTISATASSCLEAALIA